MKNNTQQKILELYSSRPSLAVKSREIAQLLNIRNNQEYQSLRTTLHQLVDSGTLEFDLNSGYKLHIPKGRVKGVLRILKNNYGVVTANEKKGEILISLLNFLLSMIAKIVFFVLATVPIKICSARLIIFSIFPSGYCLLSSVVVLE